MPKSLTEIESAHDDAVGADEVHVAHVDFTADHINMAANFTLAGGAVNPLWEGAFSQAIEGKLSGTATRWHINGVALIVDGVRKGAAVALADAVTSAIDTANGFVAAETADAQAENLAREVRYREGQEAASDTQQAIRAHLRL